MEIIYNWAIEFVKGLNIVWNWLITPIDIFNNILGIDIIPLYLVVGGTLITGLIRRLL